MKPPFLRKNNTLIIDRELNDLDLFVQEFIEILQRFSSYLIVSGYVSISTGRVRGTEDIDVLVPVLSQQEFANVFNALDKSGFWCYQSDSASGAFSYHKNGDSIRFARKDHLFPNMEFIPITKEKKAQWFEFTHPQKIRISNFEFLAAPFEFEILYKELRLGSQKDLEDAQHLRQLFGNNLDNTFMKECEQVIRQ